MLDYSGEERTCDASSPPSGSSVDEGTSSIERCFHIFLEKSALSRDIDELQDTVIQLATTLIEQQQELEKQKVELERLRRWRYGRSSEKLERQSTTPEGGGDGADKKSSSPGDSESDR